MPNPPPNRGLTIRSAQVDPHGDMIAFCSDANRERNINGTVRAIRARPREPLG